MSPHTLVGGMDLPASRQGAAGQAWSRPARSKERRGADLGGTYTDPLAAEAFGRLQADARRIPHRRAIGVAL